MGYYKKKYEEQKEQQEWNETISARLILVCLVVGFILFGIFAH